MNSFIENVNYVAGLDNLYGSGIELYKNNLSLKSVQHDIELKFSYYSNDDKKIHSIVHLEPGVLVGGIDDTLLSFKTLVESSITGSEFICTVSSGVQNFVINNIVMVNIAIDSNNNTYKAYELEMKVITAGAATYDVFGEVKDSLKILPSLAMITASDIDAIANVYEIQEEVITVSENIVNVTTVSDSIANVNTVGISISNVNIVGEDIANVNTVASNIIGLNSIVSNITEILLADDNAAIATTKALESSDSSAASLQSALDSAASAASALSSATTATTKANEASVSATSAATSATNANTSATQSATSAWQSATSASLAASSATDANTSKLAAASSAGAASASAVSANQSALDAIEALDEFTDIYLGRNVTAPTVDNDGNALVEGTIYWNTTSKSLFIHDGTDWNTAVFDASGAVTSFNSRDGAVTLTNSDVTEATGQDLSVVGTPSFASVKVTGGTGLTAGVMSWNADESTVDLVLENGVTLQLGQENNRLVRANGSVTNGRLCMFAGTIGNSGRVKVKHFTGLFGEHSLVYGIATQNITSGSDGYITTNGKVREIDTTGAPYGEVWADEDVIYAKPNDNGALTNVEPGDDQLKMIVATVIHAHTNGTLEIRVLPFNENMIAKRANKLTTARDIEISGVITGYASFDGSGDINIATSIGSVDFGEI